MGANKNQSSVMSLAKSPSASKLSGMQSPARGNIQMNSFSSEKVNNPMKTMVGLDTQSQLSDTKSIGQ